MNETIKIRTEITPLEGLKMLVESEGKPIEDLVFKREIKGPWRSGSLEYVAPSHLEPFKTGNAPALYCAKVTELDPCQAPEGCLELEPFLAYVGETPQLRYIQANWELGRRSGALWINYGDHWGICRSSDPAVCTDNNVQWAIDVHAAWAQEHFPEHCRIRNHQEPAKYGYHKGRLIVAPEGWEIVPEGENTPESVFFGVECGWYVTIADNGPAVVAGDESILAYARKIQGPDAFDAWFRGMHIDPNGYKDTYRAAYELGQANPKPTLDTIP